MAAIPKRSEERRRVNKVPDLERATVHGAVRIPPASKDWHPLARDWYRSLKASGQSRWYEPSDWQTARLLADQMSKLLADSQANAALLNTIVQASRDLLTTEAQRRRMHVELTRETSTVDPESDRAAADVRDIRSRLASASA